MSWIRLYFLSDDPETIPYEYKGISLQMGENTLEELFYTGNPTLDRLTVWAVGMLRVGSAFQGIESGFERFVREGGGVFPEPEAAAREYGDRAYQMACRYLHERGETECLDKIPLPDKMEVKAFLLLSDLLGMDITEWDTETDHEPDELYLGPVDTHGTCTVLFYPPDGIGVFSVEFQGWNGNTGEIGEPTVSIQERAVK